MSKRCRLDLNVPYDSSRETLERKSISSSPPSIFTIGSPEKEIEKFTEGFGEFLQNCYFCKKRLNACDIFMYNDHPFCTVVCRENKMKLDGFGGIKDDAKRLRKPTQGNVGDSALRRN
ncbi:hypothetical protein M5689_002338 [Euphorbia peplus]|nr:hypothetical protein M5689_002338 [Euphorbia peplus]